MITAETIAAALPAGWRRFYGKTSDWVSNGVFSVKGDWLPPGEEKEEKEGLDALVARIKSMAGRPVLEAVELRLPRTEKGAACEGCGGAIGDHECNCGHRHECEDCKGSGYAMVTDDVGQRVYVNGDGSTVVDPRLGELLDGLTVVREAGPADVSMLVGYDNGEPVVAVMPMRQAVRAGVARAAS